MIGYITVGTNDLNRSIAFYDALMGAVGIRQLWAHGNMAAWGETEMTLLFA